MPSIYFVLPLIASYRGQTLPSKEFQISQVKSTTRGSVQLLERGGHMVSLNFNNTASIPTNRALGLVPASRTRTLRGRHPASAHFN
jgi:hypothetical protein